MNNKSVKRASIINHLYSLQSDGYRNLFSTTKQLSYKICPKCGKQFQHRGKYCSKECFENKE